MINDRLLLNLNAEFELRRRNRTFLEYLEWMSPELSWDVRHLAYIRPYLQRIINGESLLILCLEPPRHGKTTQNTIHMGAGYLYKPPENRVILGAYNQEFANSLSLQTRQLYRNSVPFKTEKDAVMEWHTNKGGGLKAGGVDSGVSGRGCNLMLLDDLIKNRKLAHSKKIRDDAWKGFITDFYSRLEPGGSIILTMTHWHYDDIAGRILNSDFADDWIVIRFPAIAEEGDILGRKKGEALWPERFPIEKLLEFKKLYGDDFNALYQQRPVIISGNLIKREWFIAELTANWPIKYDFIGQFWDTAFKAGKHNDYSVCVTLAKRDGVLYLLNVFREKLEFPELKDEILRQAQYYKPHFIGIEDKASGQSAIQELSRTNELPVKPEAINVTSDKEARVNAITPILRNEGLKVPSDAYWLDDLLDECSLFPQAPHDDQVDSLSMGLNYMRESGYDLMSLIK